MIGARYLILVVVLAGACGGQPSSSSTGASAPVPSPTATAAATPAATSEQSLGPPASYVAIGDSLATGDLCACPSYPGAYSTLASAALGQRVQVRNLAVPGISTANLLTRISEPPMPGALRGADIITVTIGINDLRRCLPSPDAQCFDDAVTDASSNIVAILDEIARLQGGHPHVLRVTALFNQRIGDPAYASLGEPFQELWADALAEVNAAICSATTDHGGVCIELMPIFNGPAGDQDAAALLSPDHDHPNGEGNQLIAEAIAAIGYAPLQP